MAYVPAEIAVSKSTLNAGDAQTFSVVNWRDATSVTIRCVCGSYQVQLSTLVKSSGRSSVTWTSPLSIMEQFTTSISGTITYYCDHMRGGTKITTTSITCRVTVPQTPSDYLPILENADITITDIASKPTEYDGLYVQGISKLRIQSNPSAQYGATIQEVKVEIADLSNTIWTLQGTDVWTQEIPISGALIVRVHVTDSRGCGRAVTIQKYVQEYFRPRITSCAAYRCVSATDWHPGGGDTNFICVAPRGEIAPVNNTNTKACTVYYRPVGGSLQNTPVTLYSYDLTADQVYVIFAAPSSQTYDEIYCVLTDAYASTTYHTGGVTSDSAPLVIDPDHDAWGWGGVPAISRGHQWFVPAYFRDDTYVYDGAGSYYKLNDAQAYLSDTGWLDLSLGYGLSPISYMGAKYRRIGKQVFVDVGITGITQDFTRIATLPAGFAPVMEVNVAGRYYNLPDAQVAINNSGEIYAMMCRVPWNAGAELKFQLSFLID